MDAMFLGLVAALAFALLAIGNGFYRKGEEVLGLVVGLCGAAIGGLLVYVVTTIWGGT